jgi:molybdate transport system ATP-binding protein
MALSVDIKLALEGFRLEVAHRFELAGITALFGASGAGKSLLLRVISGLETGASGQVSFGGECWQGDGRFVPTDRRGVGYVFQDARLFEHLDVAGNLRFAARRAGSPALDAVIKTLDLQPLLGRRVGALSGGEKQRVAIGRSLLSAPRLLLMDEPLAALDHARKTRLLPYIARLPEAFGLPVIYVTHAVEEVARLADRMVVLAGGKVLAAGGVADVLARLDIAEASGKFEAGSVVRAVVTGQDAHFRLTRLEVAGQALTMPASAVDVGAELRLRIRARDVAIAVKRPEGLSIRNVLRGQILEITLEPETAFAELLLDIGDGQRVRARITRASVAEMGLENGDTVYALIKSVSFDRRALPRA